MSLGVIPFNNVHVTATTETKTKQPELDVNLPKILHRPESEEQRSYYILLLGSGVHSFGQTRLVGRTHILCDNHTQVGQWTRSVRVVWCE